MLLGRFSSADLVPGGRVIERTAVRGVLFRGRELLLLASRHGDYKFPGGGVEPGESFGAALQREFHEECGLVEVTVGPGVGSTIEEVPAAESAYDVFRMTSHYFRCCGGKPRGVRQLEGYEAELQLVPRWMTVDEALAANHTVRAGGVGVMRWLAREIAVLEWLASQAT
jgi:8-oxo-dGTP pyrophosphatase MutT (NUDIX family)